MKDNQKESILVSRKYYKKNKILSILRYNQEVSRFKIKKMTSYSMTTVIQTVDELIEDNFIVEEHCNENRVGRRPLWLKLNPEVGYFIGVDFNATSINCVCLNFLAETIVSIKTDINYTYTSEQIISKIIATIYEIIDKIGTDNPRIFGIGIGVPGYYDSIKGIAIDYAPLPKWKNVVLKDIIQEEFKLPCYIENNVSVMAFAYKWLKYQGEPDDFIFVSIRNGSRIVPIINNQLFLNKKGYAGQLGHLKMPNSNRLCTCGKRGCLNAEITDWAIRNKVVEAALSGQFEKTKEEMNYDINEITIYTFLELVHERNPVAMEILNTSAYYLGYVLGGVIDILAPKTIVLSGKLAKLGNVFIDAVREGIVDNSISENNKKLIIKSSDFNDDIGAIGAAALVLQEEFEFINKTV